VQLRYAPHLIRGILFVLDDYEIVQLRYINLPFIRDCLRLRQTVQACEFRKVECGQPFD